MTHFKDIRPCACGCGEVVKPGSTWIVGHNRRLNHPLQGRTTTGRRVYTRRPAIHRILEKVVVDEDGCWLVEGMHLDVGYTKVNVEKGVTKGSHVVSYEFFHGPVPKGLVVDHTCHNEAEWCNLGARCKHRRCVNPKHLEATTYAQNTLRGRSPRIAKAVNAAITHCPQGHEYTPENTYVNYPNGKHNRHCRICISDANKRMRARRRAAS